jgi:branched-chain amino acid transport system substrate-binding protein
MEKSVHGMARKWGVGLTALTLTALVAACGSSSSSKSSTGGTGGSGIPAGPIKIGMLLPESGPYAPASTLVKANFQAGVDLVNKAGGIKGHQIQLITMNDQADPAVAVAAANELISDHVVMMDEVGFSTTIDQVIPVFDRAHIPMLSEETGDVYRDAATYPYFFPSLPANSEYNQILAEATQAVGATKVAILNDTTPISKDWVDEYKAYAKEAGITVAGTYTFPQTAVDVTTQVEQAKATGVNTLILLADAGLPQVYSALQSVGWSPTIIGSYFIFVEGWANLLKLPLANTTYYPCVAALPSPTATYSPTFTNALQSILAAVGSMSPNDQQYLTTYDTALMEKAAIEHVGVNGPALKAYLEKFNNASFTSPVLEYTFTATNHEGQSAPIDICRAGQPLGPMDVGISDATIMAKIHSQPKLPLVPNFGPGDPDSVK